MSPIEIIVGLVIIAAVAYYISNRKTAETVTTTEAAPYKVEAPVVEIPPEVIAQPHAEVAAPVVEAKPAKKPAKAKKEKAPAKPKAAKAPTKAPAKATTKVKATPVKAKAKIRVAK